MQPRLTGRAFLIRYADDFVIGFASEEDARRVMDVLPKRFGKYGLTLHPEKTRLVPFRRPWFDSVRRDGVGRGPGRSTCSGSRTTGLVPARELGGQAEDGEGPLQPGAEEGRRLVPGDPAPPVPDQHRGLVQKLRGHYAYYGITGNAPALSRFRNETLRIWRKWLNRRSQRARMPWNRFVLLLKRYPLPESVIVHSIYRCAAKP